MHPEEFRGASIIGYDFIRVYRLHPQAGDADKLISINDANFLAQVHYGMDCEDVLHLIEVGGVSASELEGAREYRLMFASLLEIRRQYQGYYEGFEKDLTNRPGHRGLSRALMAKIAAIRDPKGPQKLLGNGKAGQREILSFLKQLIQSQSIAFQDAMLLSSGEDRIRYIDDMTVTFWEEVLRKKLNRFSKPLQVPTKVAIADGM